MITDEALNFYESIAQISPVLEAIESRLRQKGDITLANEFGQFQVDAALEFAWSIYGHKDTPDGKEINELWKNHQQITPDRYSVFYRVAEALKGHWLENDCLAIVKEIPKFKDASNSDIKLTREI